MKFLKVFTLVLLAAAISACSVSVPFSVSTKPLSISIPTTLNVYVETSVDIPPEARDSRLSFDEVTVSYNINKNDTYAAHVALYATEKTEADNIKSSPETLADVSMGLSDTSYSGSTVSTALKNRLNAHAANIVLGVENLTFNPIGNVTAEVVVNFKGHYKLF